MRNEEACITEKSSRIGYAEKFKKAVFDRGKNWIFRGIFPSLDTLVITLIFIFGSKSYHIRLVAVFIDKWTGIKKARIV